MPKAKPRAKDEDGYGLVYFIGDPMEGPVKIGFTSHPDPKHRLSQLQTASPQNLMVLGNVDGTIELERKIHHFLDLHRIKGEWFERKPALAMLDHLTPIDYRDKKNDNFCEQLADAAFSVHIQSLQKNEKDFEEDFEEDLVISVARHLLLDWAHTFKSCKSKKPLPFLAWLTQQKEREDAAGDLAKDAVSDKQFPPIGSLVDYLSYGMEVAYDPSVTRTIADAWIECQQAILHLKP